MSLPATPALEGIRILDLASVGPAARASRMLADYGAQIVKIAPTSKRGAVQIRPAFHTYGAGRGMQRMQIDLKSEAGKEAFLRMAETADVVIESYRPGVIARLGLGFEVLRARNPRLILCSTSGYGQDGPYASWAGHDINYLALSGFLACSEPRADGGPPIPGATVADSAGGGMHAVIAILAALVKRGRTGEGEHLDVSAAEGVMSLMSLSVDQYLATGEGSGPRQALLTGRYACYDLYRTRDDKWLSVGAIEPHFFANLCKALGLEHFAGEQMNDDRQDEMRAAFQEAFLTRDRDDWARELAPANTCVAPVLDIPELTKDPHLRARGLFMKARHEEHGEFEQVAPVLAGGVREQPVHEVAAAEHSDCDALLSAAGLAPEEIRELRAAGAVE